MRIFLFISMLCVATSYAYNGTPEQQVASFFKDIRADRSTQAVDKLYPANPGITKMVQQIALLKQRIATLPSLYGDLIGTENVVREEISPSIVRIVEVAKYEHFPIIWEFYFYKPRETWIISQCTFVDQFQTVDSKKR